MKRQFTKLLLVCMSIAVLGATVSSCKGKVKDEDLKTSVETAIKANPDLQSVTVDVKDAVASLSGEVKTDGAKSAAETSAKEVKGLTNVVNNITVAPAPAPVVTAPVISADDSLSTNIVAAIKDNPGVSATVKDGVVTLTGEIKKSDLPKLMQKLNALKPKKVETKLLKVK